METEYNVQYKCTVYVYGLLYVYIKVQYTFYSYIIIRIVSKLLAFTLTCGLCLKSQYFAAHVSSLGC